MATTKITDLTAYTDPVNTDVLPIVDVTSDVTKKVSIANVMKNASLGSNTAPGIAFDGDPNTGIYSPGADQVAVTTGGTQRLLIDSSGAVTIAGDLTVNGTTTNINTTNLVVEDKNIVLGDVTSPTDVTADGGGLTLKGTTDKTLNWVDATDAWTSSEHVNIASGKEYRIAGTKVLDATSLGSAVLITSANITDGTIVNADINASAAIAGTKISPDFGSQNRTSTGTSTAASFIPSSSTAPTNGLYLPAANSVALATGGSGRLFIDSNGTVRVNTSVAATSSGGLNVEATSSGSSTVPLALLNRGTGNNSGVYLAFRGLSASNAETDYAYMRMVATDTTTRNGRIEFWTANSGSPSEKLCITSGGLVGIGESSPGALLHVKGTNGDNSIIRIQNSTAGGQQFDLVAGAPGVTNPGFSIYDRTNSANRFYIDSSGRCGIGTTSVGYGKLCISNGGAEGLEIQPGDSANVNVLQHYNRSGTAWVSCLNNAAAHIFTINGGGNEKARIDSSGRLLVGTSSAFDTGISGTNYQAGIEGAGSAAAFALKTNKANTEGAYISLSKSRGTTANSKTIVSDGDLLGYISFEGADGTNIIRGATIESRVDGTPGTNDMPGRLVFSTTADGASSPTEHVRINQAGALKVSSNGTYGGATSSVSEFYQTNNASALNARATNASFTDSVFTLDADRNTTNTTYYFARFSCTGVAYRFQVADSGNVTNTNNSYTGISDLKLKENISDANSQWRDIKSLQVRNYNFKEETGQPSHRQIGLIAQEVEQVSPGLVLEETDRDAEGNDLGTVTKSVNYSVLYMKAVKALQEAMERIETLEAKVAALEA